MTKGVLIVNDRRRAKQRAAIAPDFIPTLFFPRTAKKGFGEDSRELAAA